LKGSWLETRSLRTGDDLRRHLLGPTTRALNLSCRERPLRAGHVEALRLRDDSEPETTEAFLCALRGGTRHPRLVDASVEGCGADAGSRKFGRLEPLANAPSRRNERLVRLRRRILAGPRTG